MKKFMALALAVAMGSSSVASITAVAADTQATVSNAKVAVNGTEIAPQAYTIDGYTYFKLRDVAQAVAGTAAGFDVIWDKDARMISLKTGVPYEVAADAAEKTETGTKTAILSKDPILVNEEKAVLTAYNIDGYTYFKLRDLGVALGFEVTWDQAAKRIGISTEAVEKPTEVVDKDTKQETATTVSYDLKLDEEYIVQNETFMEEVVVNCAPNAEAEATPYGISFINCVFEKGLRIVSDCATDVIIGEDCVFAEGTGIVVEEVTEGNAKTMTPEDFFVTIYTQVDGVQVKTEDAVKVYGEKEVTFTVNGVLCTVAEKPEKDKKPIEGHFATHYYEVGEEESTLLQAIDYVVGETAAADEVATETTVEESEAEETAE